MTREEALHWWRQGYESGILAAQRATDTRGGADHTIAIREFHATCRADQQAKADALLLEAMGVLARAMLGDHPAERRSRAASDGPRWPLPRSTLRLSLRRPANWPPRPGLSPIARSVSPSAAGRASTPAASLSLARVLARPPFMVMAEP
jgi:hypothetical protein